ncbi:MAG: helicase-exonuclease AddAB subunit AddB [Eubacteriales bacterium]|nr:helicase-exonuclease AddAB subunit AddB [Eubacteriales bacterium]
MALQFIFGGAGRGKTWYIEHRVTKEAIQHPQKQYFVVVPEQFTMQTQKNLVTLSERKGLLNIEVQSFLRLAFRIFGETGAGNIPVMDDMGKTMILKKVLLNEQKQLEYFGDHVHKKGYIAEIKSFLSELMQYGVTEERLDDMLDTAAAHPVLQRKLQDMKVAYDAFLKYIKDHYITSEEVLTVFAGVVGESSLLRGAEIYLDGFTGFTPLQYRLIRELLRVCDHMYVTVTLDTREAIWHVGEKYKLFYMSRKTIYQLRKIAQEEHIEVKKEIWTGKDRQKTRFREEPSLEILEQQLFRYPIEPSSGQPEGISIHVLRQPDQEVAFLTMELMKLRQQEDFHYRDIAVVTGDLSIYGILVKEEFERCGIPCFVDQKKSILTNPYVDMLCAVLNILRKDFDYASIMQYVKSDYSGIDTDHANLLDNFLLASGIRGHKRWQEEWDSDYIYRRKQTEVAAETANVINQVRIDVWDKLGVLYGQIARGRHSVQEYVEALCDFMEEQEHYVQLQGKVERFQEKGDREAAREYEQIYEIVIGVLDRLVELMGTETMLLREFQEIFNTGLEEARIGLIPPGIDQVVVGDLNRTRLTGVRYLFFLGLNDGNIPQTKGSGGILSEAERNFLTEAEYELAPTSREQIYTEQFYLYLGLTKPSRHLYLTYSETGNDGSARRPAYLIDRVCKIFPDLELQYEEQNRDYAHLLANDLGERYLIQGLRQGSLGDRAWQEIYRQYYRDKDQRKQLERLLEAAYYVEPESRITREAATALYQEIITGSTSQFERYSSCPFAYFMQYGLKLEERQEHQVELFDVGNIVHEALERYTRELLKRQVGWQDLAEEERHVLANQCLNATVEEYKNGLLYDTERDTYLVMRLRRILQRSIWAITEQMKLGDFHTVESELSFRMDGEAQQIIGRVDRIDTLETEDATYVKVVDYKTGAKELSLSDLYYGLQMQLVIYLKAAVDRRVNRQKKMVIPAGVLYYHIDDPILTGKMAAEERDQQILKELRMKGLVNENDPVLPALDHNFQNENGGLAASRQSIVAPFATKQDGSLKATSATLTTEEFQAIIDYTEQKLQQIGADIQAGNTCVHPYQRMDSARSTPCAFCTYHGICRFDPKIAGNRYNKLRNMTRDEVLEAVRKEQEDGDEMDRGPAEGN